MGWDFFDVIQCHLKTALQGQMTVAKLKGANMFDGCHCCVITFIFIVGRCLKCKVKFKLSLGLAEIFMGLMYHGHRCLVSYNLCLLQAGV